MVIFDSHLFLPAFSGPRLAQFSWFTWPFISRQISYLPNLMPELATDAWTVLEAPQCRTGSQVGRFRLHSQRTRRSRVWRRWQSLEFLHVSAPRLLFRASQKTVPDVFSSVCFYRSCGCVHHPPLHVVMEIRYFFSVPKSRKRSIWIVENFCCSADHDRSDPDSLKRLQIPRCLSQRQGESPHRVRLWKCFNFQDFSFWVFQQLHASLLHCLGHPWHVPGCYAWFCITSHPYLTLQFSCISHCSSSLLWSNLWQTSLVLLLPSFKRKCVRGRS